MDGCRFATNGGSLAALESMDMRRTTGVAIMRRFAAALAQLVEQPLRKR
jgi:hypothetical protein